MSVDYRRPQYGKRHTRVFTVAPDNTFSLCLALLVHVGEAVCADRCLHADSFAHAGGIGCTDIVQMFSLGISSKIKQGGQAVDVGCHTRALLRSAKLVSEAQWMILSAAVHRRPYVASSRPRCVFEKSASRAHNRSPGSARLNHRTRSDILSDGPISFEERPRTVT